MTDAATVTPAPAFSAVPLVEPVKRGRGRRAASDRGYRAVAELALGLFHHWRARLALGARVVAAL